MKVLITGGAGFIGSHLVRGLLARGDSVRVLDNFSSGKERNLEEIAADFELLRDDVRDSAVCKAACAGVEAVIHLAAIGSVPMSIQDPIMTNQVNVDGTLNLLLAAREAGVRRFVFASSSAVYGDAPEKIKVETLPPRPQSPYAVQKLAAEAYCGAFWRVYGLEAISLRYFNIFGPRQDPESTYAAVIPRFATRLLDGTAPTIYGDGGQTRDFTYVENVVRANLLALEAPKEALGFGYNIGCGHATSLLELYRRIRERVGGAAAKIKPVHAPAQPGDVRDSLASIAAAEKALGYVPTVGVEDGIRLTIDWYRAKPASVGAAARLHEGK
ncbi:MAG TPA: SDR family oxidoreductase [Planctomycetota bacterium]|nr:SDR family oxidoreductase [Planctomycetota bacterium]